MEHAHPQPLAARRTGLALLAAAALAGLAPAAQARNVRLMESINDTARVTRVHDILGNLDIRFGGESGRRGDIVRRDVTVTGTGSTKVADVGEDDKVRPSDHDLCARAFEDAVTQLAFSARQSHATAITGVVSTYQGKDFDDPDHFECHAGALKAYVSLRAQLVRGPVDTPAMSTSPAPIPVSPANDPPRPAATFQPLPPVPAPAPN